MDSTIIDESNIDEYFDVNEEEVTDKCSCEKPVVTVDNGYTVCMSCGKVLSLGYDDKNIPDGISISELAPKMSTRGLIRYNNLYINTKNNWENTPYHETVLLNTRDFIKKKYTAYLDKISFERGIKYRLDDTIVMKSVKLFDTIIKHKITRDPIKTGVIAKCLYYAAKESYIYISKKELSLIFNIPIKIVTSGNKIINNLIHKDAQVAEMFNLTPFQLKDFGMSLSYYFPQLSELEISHIIKFIDRVSDGPLTINKTPISLLAGILCNIIKKYNFSISISDVKTVLHISSSTINIYTVLLKPLICY
jgi:transcription initiation factor TFIIIB Brf1 subunit/transcription initiation factor TFIIB